MAIRRTVSRPVLLVSLVILVVSAAAAAKTKLTFGTWQDPEEFARGRHDAQLAVFTDANPDIDVEVILIAAHREFAAKIGVLAATGDLPDSMMIPPEQVAPIVATGAIEDLTPWIARQRLDQSNWLPGAIEGARFKGITFGMPLACVGYTYAYNKDILSERGVIHPNADEYVTWDQIRDIARKTTIDVDGDGKPEVMGYIQGFAFNYFLPAIWQAGGRFYDENMLVQADTPPVYEAINWLLTMTHDDRTHQATGRAGFYSGRIATARFGSWQMPNVLAANTPLGVTSGIQHREKADVVYVTTVVMTAGSRNKDLVWKLLTALASRESQTHVASRVGIPIRRDVPLPLDTRAWHMGFLNNLGTARPFPYHIQSGYIMDAFDAAMAPVWSREKTAESVLKDFQRVINAHLSQGK